MIEIKKCGKKNEVNWKKREQDEDSRKERKQKKEKKGKKITRIEETTEITQERKTEKNICKRGFTFRYIMVLI